MQLNATARCGDMVICDSLIDTEIQSRSVGCRQRQNTQPHYDCRCCRFGISGMTKHYSPKFRSLSLIGVGIHVKFTTGRYSMTLISYSSYTIMHGPDDLGWIPKGVKDSPRHYGQLGSKIHSALLPACRDLYSQAQKPHATVKFILNSAHRWRLQLPFPPHPFTTRY